MFIEIKNLLLRRDVDLSKATITEPEMYELRHGAVPMLINTDYIRQICTVFAKDEYGKRSQLTRLHVGEETIFVAESYDDLKRMIMNGR